MSHWRYPITAAQKAAFEADGAIHLPAVLAGNALDAASQAADRVLAAEAELPEEDSYFKRLGLWRREPSFNDLCFRSAVPEIGAQLLASSRINLLYDQLFVKEKASGTPTPWHNDLPYWPLTGRQVLTVWLALDAIGLENGGLEFVRASHLGGPRYRPFYSTDDGQVARFFEPESHDDYIPLPDFSAERARHEILSREMAPGDAVVFHSYTVHGAPGNQHPQRPRRGYAIRLTGDDVRYRTGPVWNQDLVNPDLKDGDRLDSVLFPLLLQSEEAA